MREARPVSTCQRRVVLRHRRSLLPSRRGCGVAETSEEIASRSASRIALNRSVSLRGSVENGTTGTYPARPFIHNRRAPCGRTDRVTALCAPRRRRQRPLPDDDGNRERNRTDAHDDESSLPHHATEEPREPHHPTRPREARGCERAVRCTSPRSLRPFATTVLRDTHCAGHRTRASDVRCLVSRGRATEREGR